MFLLYNVHSMLHEGKYTFSVTAPRSHGAQFGYYSAAAHCSLTLMLRFLFTSVMIRSVAFQSFAWATESLAYALSGVRLPVGNEFRAIGPCDHADIRDEEDKRHSGQPCFTSLASLANSGSLPTDLVLRTVEAAALPCAAGGCD